MDTGTTVYNPFGTTLLQDEDLGTGSAFGFSVGKYLTDSFRLELEAIKRTGYEYDARITTAELVLKSKYIKQSFIYQWLL